MPKRSYSLAMIKSNLSKLPMLLI